MHLTVKYRLVIQKLGVLNDMLKEAEAIKEFHSIVGFVTQDPVLFSPVKYSSGCMYHLNNVSSKKIQR